jgi:hypothetical protein
MLCFKTCRSTVRIHLYPRDDPSMKSAWPGLFLHAMYLDACCMPAMRKVRPVREPSRDSTYLLPYSAGFLNAIVACSGWVRTTVPFSQRYYIICSLSIVNTPVSLIQGMWFLSECGSCLHGGRLKLSPRWMTSHVPHEIIRR